MSTSSPPGVELALRPDWRVAALLCAAHALGVVALLSGGVPAPLRWPLCALLIVCLYRTLRRSAMPLALTVRRRRPNCLLREGSRLTNATLSRELWRSARLVGLELNVRGRRQRLWFARPWMSRADLRRLRLWLLSLRASGGG